MAIVNSGSLDNYLSEIESMKGSDPILGPNMGGQPELIALSSMLNLRIHNLDVRAIGQGLAVNDKNSFIGNSNDPEIILLLRPGHYDLGLKNKS